MKTRSRFNTVERNDIVQKSQQCLWGKDGVVGLEYLVDQRKIGEDTIRAFELGYIPPYIGHQLAGRIIFPFYDPSGNLVVVSSRRIDENNDLLPIYWHESYEKDFYLYGIYLAKKWLRKYRFCLIAEGQFDVLQLYSNGIKNVVALCGTKFSDIQLAMIHRYCEEIVVLLDTDENLSGQKATEKIYQKIHSKSYKHSFANVRDKIVILSFSENIDPDEYVRKYGAERLRQMIRSQLKQMRKIHGY